MPPASPVPGWSRGEVCTEMVATRWGRQSLYADATLAPSSGSPRPARFTTARDRHRAPTEGPGPSTAHGAMRPNDLTSRPRPIFPAKRDIMRLRIRRRDRRLARRPTQSRCERATSQNATTPHPTAGPAGVSTRIRERAEAGDRFLVMAHTKIAVVTGASSSIGAASARRLAAEGFHVVIAARRADRLAGLAKEITESGGLVTAVPADVTNDDDVAALTAAVADLDGDLELLANI